MKFVHASDIHMQFKDLELPDGDCLIISGDALNYGDTKELIKFNTWLGQIKHRYKHIIFVAGNHDRALERYPDARNLITNATYLQDEEVTIEGIRIYGSPWQPEFCNWAFNLPRGPEIKHKWDLIPEGIDILITHGPPKGVRDFVLRPNGAMESLGCQDLLEAVIRVKPKYHLFGHIHYANGVESLVGTTFINSAMCDERYNPRQPAHVFEFTK